MILTTREPSQQVPNRILYHIISHNCQYAFARMPCHVYCLPLIIIVNSYFSPLYSSIAAFQKRVVADNLQFLIISRFYNFSSKRWTDKKNHGVYMSVPPWRSQCGHKCNLWPVAPTTIYLPPILLHVVLLLRWR